MIGLDTIVTMDHRYRQDSARLLACTYFISQRGGHIERTCSSAHVREHLKEIVEDEDLSKYIL